MARGLCRLEAGRGPGRRRGGDPTGGVTARGGTLERILEETPRADGDQTVVVVSHGSALTLGITHLLGLDPSAWFGLRGLDNCRHGVVVPGERVPGWTLAEWNVQ
ncbi:histidine phosphatase family protein [Actinomyces sp. Z16]|uniref:histidine phosphatase family protein n=1 Tax=Actinomyces sp. Z16 TaxID=2079536 RepID=UPI002D778BE8|nr:histidine phosphatase family protein [Actinomyces sp. Z16]